MMVIYSHVSLLFIVKDNVNLLELVLALQNGTDYC